MTVERFGITAYGNGDVVHAPFVRAGKWVFGTGLRAVLPDGRPDPAVLRPDRPLGVAPQAEREAEAIFERMGRSLAEAGSALARVVRLDQYYPDARNVDPYHAARKRALAGQVAPSTSVIVEGLLNPGVAMDVQVLAPTLASGYAIEPLARDRLNVPGTSGYAPCIRAGDLVFVAGQLARDASGGIAPEAMVPPGQLWNGTRIKLETDYLVQKRLVPALSAADSSLELVLKAQVYLSHAADFPAFWQAWSRAFGGKVPPTTVVPVRHPAFGTSAATIEVNLIAAHAQARARIRDIECAVELPGRDMLPARSFDGILFVAGLMGIEDGGVCAAARGDDAAPYYRDGVHAQMTDILAKARTIFAAGGSDLSEVARALYFLPDLASFRSVHTAWDPALRDAGLPFTAVCTGSPPLAPGADLVVDLWGHVPG